MSKKKIAIIVVIAAVVIFGAVKIFLRPAKTSFNVATVQKGTIVQTVSESGTVKAGQDIDLSFSTSGTIKKIYAQVGDQVGAGQVLATLDTGSLLIQISEAQATLDAAKAQLQVSKTTALNSQTSLQSAQQNLDDVKTTASESLSNAYEDALNTLSDSYIKIYNALNEAKTIQQTYFGSNDPQGLTVKESESSIQEDLDNAKSALDKAKETSSDTDIDAALLVMSDSLSDTASNLATIRQACDESVYYSTVSSTDKSALDTQRGYINTAETAITTAQQDISTARVTGNTNINTANNQLQTAQGSLKEAQQNVDLYSAKVNQAQSQLDLLNRQVKDSSIVSPVAGKISAVDKQVGETVQPAVPVFSFLSSGPFQVKVDIYEGDIVKVATGNSVDIQFTAFPNQDFSGKVTAINPDKEVIDGVVYYEVTIDLLNPPDGLKPGMTADIAIKTAEKDNVLEISGNAITQESDKSYVQVVKEDNTTEKTEITTGLQGNDNMVEVLSGLQEGEKIAIPK